MLAWVSDSLQRRSISRRCSNAGRVTSAPDDHFTAGPDCRVTVSGSGRVGDAGGCPTVRAGIVSARRCSRRLLVVSTPDDHFAAGPHCRVIDSRRRARWWCWWLSNCRCRDCICPPVFKKLPLSNSAPDDHFAAGPHCRVSGSCRGRVGGAGGCPTVGAGIVSPAGVQRTADLVRPRRSFRCRSTLPCDRFGHRAHWWCWWLSNYPCWDCISRRCSKMQCCHQLRPRRSFRCRSTLPCDRFGQRARW